MSRSTLVGAAAALAACFAAPTTAAGETPSDVLMERHADALGGREAIGRIRSIATSGEIEMLSSGMKGTISSTTLLPCLSYREARLGLFVVKQGFDGQRNWMVGPNGMLQILRDEGSVKNRATSCLLESFGYLDAAYDSIEASRTVAVDSTLCHVLTIFLEDGYPCRIYLDPSSWLISMIEIDSSTGTVEQRFYDYREAGGVMFPFRTVTTQRAIGQSIEVRTHTIDINREIDPAVFLPPGSVADDFSFTAGGDSASIDFLYINRHIYLSATPDGGPERLFVLDSGAGMTMIDEKFAGELGLEPGGTIPGAGAAGMTDFQMTRMPGLDVGGIRFEEQTVIVYPISGLTERYSGIEAGGVLGYDFLSRFVTRIDYDERLVTLFRRGSQTVPSTADTIDAPLLHNIFSVGASLDYGLEGLFLIDTGASASILQKSFADRHDLLAGRKTAEIVVAGAGGEDRAAVARFDSLRIGGSVLAGPVFTIPLGEKGLGAIEGISGVIGNDVLERFTVWLDYADQSVVLERSGMRQRPFWPDLSGIQVSTDELGRVVARYVIPDSPADEAGILSGDVLESVGDIRAAAENIGPILRALEGAAGDRLDIIYVRNGEKRRARIVLRTYI